MELAAAPVIVGLVALAKRAGLPSQYAGLVAAAGGAGLGMLQAVASDRDLLSGALSGAIAGLAAAGLYSGTKALVR